MSASERLMQVIGDREVVLCAGPGGVGKTTTSAALALAAADRGKRVLVLTIDPARRLADALGVGLEPEAGQPSVEPSTVKGATQGGELWAMMLDASHTMDELVHRLTPSPEGAERLLNNIIYRQISRAMAGGQEYTAVEKLYDLRSRYDFDLIVVDTPPSQNVLDFVEAPGYLTRFLDEKIIKWFLILDPEQPPGGLGGRLLKRTTRIVWEVLSRLFGRKFLGDIVEFVNMVEVLTAEVQRRAEAIDALLRSPQALFLIVASTDELVIEDAAFLREELGRRGIPFGGFVVNRVQEPSGVEDLQAAARALSAHLPPEHVAAVVEACSEADREARWDERAVQSLREKTAWEGCVVRLPYLAQEVHDLAGLRRLARHL